MKRSYIHQLHTQLLLYVVFVVCNLFSITVNDFDVKECVSQEFVAIKLVASRTQFIVHMNVV